MKKLSFYHSMLALLMLTAGFTACSDDDNDKPKEPEVEVVTPYHFDITMTVGKHGGMNRDKSHLMQSVDSLNGGSTIDFKGAGAEISDYSMEVINRGKYYYQVPNSNDRFGKYEFKQNQWTIVQEQPFVKNTFKARNYAHAWLNDSVVVLVAANGDANGIIYTKLNTNDMTIADEGTLDIKLATGGDVAYDSFTTSGIVAYRQSDGKLFYFYYNKKKGKTSMTATNEPAFHVAVIDAKTMQVEQDNINTDQVAEMAGSAYGELLQQTVFFDESDNLYLAAFDKTDIGEEGKLLRIKKGETNFEKGYNGFPQSEGKLLTVQYLGGGKVFTYSRNDKGGNGTAIDSYSHYYSVVDLNAQTRTRMAFGGSVIPFSSGRFSQRSVFAQKENKVYFGVNTEEAQPQVYIYDVATGSVSEGVKIAEGYYFEQIRIVDEDSYTVVKE
ncbi:MAG: hypothetical protein IJ588_12850 [Prevotella sp.]|nr:hypothetical protein [Prevotella sp.]